jgi:hypothetical protein
VKELARHELADGTIGVIAIARKPRRSKAMRGWTRIDPRPWGKLGAVWRRDHGGLELHHCSHPTALRPWFIVDGKGARVTSQTFSRLVEAIAWIAKAGR